MLYLRISVSYNLKRVDDLSVMFFFFCLFREILGGVALLERGEVKDQRWIKLIFSAFPIIES